MRNCQMSNNAVGTMKLEAIWFKICVSFVLVFRFVLVLV